MTDFAKRARQWERDNRAAASIIFANPAKYPGIMQDWARAIIGKTADRPKYKKLPLFNLEAA